MSGRRRHRLSPSLFPFLAVLVCTLGTLILFLALVAQNATEAAEQNARAERMAKLRQAEQDAQPATPRLTAKSVQSLLDEEQFRIEQLVAFRDQQTNELGDRRDQLTYLQQHMDRLRQKLTQLGDEVDRAMGETEVQQIDDEEIALLRRRIDAEKKEIEKLRRDAENKTPRVVIVPHKGPNGTDRRPVYLECTSRGVTIWPEGSQISMTQLEDSNYSANPLDAALRVVRLHTMQNYGDTAPPYPLLIVRPDGIDAYAAARGAMQDWDDQFGYELVPAEVQLAYSQPDSNLKQQVDVAIRDAAARQHAQHAIARRARGGTGQFSDGSDLRGNVRRGTGRSGRLPTLSAAELDRAGRSSGFRSHRDFSPYSNAVNGNVIPYSSDVRRGARSVYSSDPQARSAYPAQDGPQAGDAGAVARRWADEMANAAAQMRASQGSEDGAGGNGQAGSEEDLGPDAPPSSQAKPGTTSLAQSPNKPQATPGDGEAGSDDAGSDGGAKPSSQMTMPSSGANTEQPPPGGAPQISLNQTPQSQPLRRQGRDWALPPEMAGLRGNSIVRNIRVECHQDRFVLLPAGGGGATEVFGFLSGDVEKSTMRLATAVRDRIQQWGPALPGGKWQPRLDVIVMPHGEMRFHQLRTLMSGSGVEIAGRASE